MTSLTDKIHWYAGAGQLIKVSHDCGSFSSWSVICAILVLPQDNFKMPRSFLIKKKPEKATRNAVHDSKAKGEPRYSLRALVRCPKGNKCIVANKSCSPNLRLRPLNISLICSPGTYHSLLSWFSLLQTPFLKVKQAQNSIFQGLRTYHTTSLIACSRFVTNRSSTWPRTRNASRFFIYSKICSRKRAFTAMDRF